MGPFFASFPRKKKEALFKLFSGGPKWGVLGGGAKVYVEKVSVLSWSPILRSSGGSEAANPDIIFVAFSVNSKENRPKSKDF